MAPAASYGSINHNDDDDVTQTVTPNDERRSSHSVIFRLVFLATAVVVVGLVAFFNAPMASKRNHYTQNAMLGTVQTEQQIPFPCVDRSEYSSVDVSEIVDPELLDPSLRASSSGGLLTVPFPTGAFWTNLVLTKSTSDQGLSYPVISYPYAYRWSTSKLQISYPPLRRLMDPISIRDIFNPDLTLDVLESTKSRHVTAFDPLSVTLRYSSVIDPPSYWETYLVQGSPYVTMAYENTTPILTALSIFKSFICADTHHCTPLAVPDEMSSITLQGTQFRITTQENLTWLLFASDTISLSYDKIHKTTVSSDAPFSGVLRLILLPPPLNYSQPHYTSQFPSVYPTANLSTAVEQRLACHANVYPVGGKVTWDFGQKRDKDVATVHFRFQTKILSKDGCTNQLLMLALPHHVQVLSTKSLKSNYLGDDVTFRSIKGSMAPVLGNVWTYDEHLTTIGFDSASTLRNAESLDDNTKRIILDQVKEDMSRVLPTLDENVYGFGKQIARLAQLAHIASVLEASETKGEDDSLTNTITTVLHRYLSAFLTGQNRDKLLYDTNFGGIVSLNGLTDSMDDFGNGWYNDHLFHYGYVLYASAVLGKLNSTFIEELGDAVDAILLDVANPANADSQQNPDHSSLHGLFPFTRHKSWFDSHSFASGLFPFADGKSMESSGESVNFYYGAYVWTMVSTTNNNNYKSNVEVNFARLLLAMEIRGVKTYWHMITPDEETDTYHASDIYNPLFAKNLMVGNVGMMDVTVATWFGIEPLYVHMINFLPVTAITSELFEKSYVDEEFKQIIKPVYQNVEMAWKGYVVCDRAMVNPTAAWEDALDLRSYELDQAISQSQVLYFASTMSGFVAPEGPTKHPEETKPGATSIANRLGSASCEENKACAALGLTGNCCPASNGAFLECCDDSASKGQGGGVSNSLPSNAETQSETSTGSSSSCTENKVCAELGLTGLCCPTAEGNSLDCCD